MLRGDPAHIWIFVYRCPDSCIGKDIGELSTPASMLKVLAISATEKCLQGWAPSKARPRLNLVGPFFEELQSLRCRIDLIIEFRAGEASQLGHVISKPRRMARQKNMAVREQRGL
jgi:hypothetical protein